ncbi:GntP family permease [Luminiphilus sp.]|nr:GntP family permease [Luminiphilus sp.]
MEAIGYLGLAGSVALLIWMALRGVDIMFAAILSSLFVIITNALPLADSLMNGFATGPLGAFTFAGKFFFLFAAGAIFGRAMGDSGAAASIALALVRKLGADRALIITTIACAALTYGGVVVFVVIFAVYPLGLQLLKEANIPKRLFCAALALGAGTFTLTALPGTPSIQNAISASALNTSLTAAPMLGMIAAAVMVVLGIWYLEHQRVRAKAAGEGFVPGPRDVIQENNSANLPSWYWAVFPLVIVIGLIVSPRLISTASGTLGELMRFAGSEPIMWPSISLGIGTILCLALFRSIRQTAFTTLGNGTNDSLMPMLNSAAIIGYGGVVVQTPGFQQLGDVVLNSSLPPLLSLFGSISVISAVTGSASGGLQIFMQTMAQDYIAMGLDPEVVHRVATVAAGGFDSLPHCGAVITMLTITQLTHKVAYRDTGVITVVIPVIAALTIMAAASVGIR